VAGKKSKGSLACQKLLGYTLKIARWTLMGYTLKLQRVHAIDQNRQTSSTSQSSGIVSVSTSVWLNE
jgi:hypothetical protein